MACYVNSSLIWQVWYLIVSIPGPCTLTYFATSGRVGCSVDKDCCLLIWESRLFISFGLMGVCFGKVSCLLYCIGLATFVLMDSQLFI